MVNIEARNSAKTMKSPPVIFAAGLCCLLFAGPSAHGAVGPAWWYSRGVLSSGTVVSTDHAPVTLGQLKWIATNAAPELETYLPNGAGTGVWALVVGFQNVSNHSPANAGQLKAVAKPFYDRLIAEGFTNAYPWTAATTDDLNMALVTIGQVKNVYGFNLGADGDADGLPDFWETGTGTFVDRYHTGTNPNDSDSDNDGLLDGVETATGSYVDSSHTGSNPNIPDGDSDGQNDGAEVTARTDPNNADVTKPTTVLVSPANASETVLIP